MPDITMCDHVSCPVVAKCRRHPCAGTRASEFHQSWAVWPDDHKGGDGCTLFWDVTPTLEEGE